MLFHAFQLRKWLLFRTFLRHLFNSWPPVITNKIKKQKTNKPAYQRPTLDLFLLQLLLLVEFSLLFFQRKKQEKRLIEG